MNSIIFKFTIFLVIVFGVQHVVCKPCRVKRLSDNYLAGLQTRIALQKIKGYAVTLPIGGGRINPNTIGRRRRSHLRALDVLFNQSEEDGDSSPKEYDDHVPYSYNSWE